MAELNYFHGLGQKMCEERDAIAFTSSTYELDDFFTSTRVGLVGAALLWGSSRYATKSCNHTCLILQTPHYSPSHRSQVVRSRLPRKSSAFQTSSAPHITDQGPLLPSTQNQSPRQPGSNCNSPRAQSTEPMKHSPFYGKTNDEDDESAETLHIRNCLVRR